MTDVSSSVSVRATIAAFLSSVNSLRRAFVLVKSDTKQSVRAFTKWFFVTRTAAVTDDDARLLLFGDGNSLRGVLELSGQTSIRKLSELRSASLLVCELTTMLLDATINSAAKVFIEQIRKLTAPQLLKYVSAMKLDKHILSSAASAALSADTSSATRSNAQTNAFKLVFLLCEFVPALSAKDLLISADALRLYEEWLAEHLSEREQVVAAEKLAQSDTAMIRRWSDVVLEDLNAADESEQSAVDAFIDDGAVTDESKRMIRDPLGIKGAIRADNEQQDGADDTANMTTARMKLLWSKMSAKSATMPTINDDAALLQSVSANQHTSINPDDANFDPVNFLTKVHRDTPLSDLRLGLSALDRSNRSRDEQLKALVTTHFGSYVYCKDTIASLHELMQAEIRPSTSKSVKIVNATANVNAMSEQVFAALLTRQKEIERIRSAMETLQRYKFLLAVSKQIRSHIDHRQFESVVRDYRTIRALQIGTVDDDEEADTQVMSQALAALNTCVVDFRQRLLTQLTSHSTNFISAHKLIRILNELDCPTDPATLYLQHQTVHIQQQLDAAYAAHSIKATRAQPAAVMPASPTSSAVSTKTPFLRSATSALLTSRKDADVIVAQTDSHAEYGVSLAKCVRTLCAILVRSLPEFTSLAKSVTEHASRPQSLSGVSVGGHKFPVHKRAVRHLLQSIFTHYAMYMTAIIFHEHHRDAQSALKLIQNNAAAINVAVPLPPSPLHRLPPPSPSSAPTLSQLITTPPPADGQSKVIGFVAMPPTMNDAIAVVIRTHRKLIRADVRVGGAISRLTRSLSVHFIENAMRNAAIRVAQLNIDHVIVECGGDTSNGVRRIAGEFDAIVRAALTAVATVRPLTNKSVVQTAIATFAELIRTLIDTIKLSRHQLAALQLMSLVRAQTLPALTDQLARLIPPSIHSLLRAIDSAPLFAAAAALIEADYVRTHAVAIAVALRQSYERSGMDWAMMDADAVIIRSIVVEALFQLVRVHAETTAATPARCDAIIRALTACIIRAVLYSLRRLSSSSVLHRGALQSALAEAEFIRKTLKAFVDDDSADVFAEAVTMMEDRIAAAADADGEPVSRRIARARERRSAAVERNGDFTATTFACLTRAER